MEKQAEILKNSIKKLQKKEKELKKVAKEIQNTKINGKDIKSIEW